LESGDASDGPLSDAAECVEQQLVLGSEVVLDERGGDAGLGCDLSERCRLQTALDGQTDDGIRDLSLARSVIDSLRNGFYYTLVL
jgi:hypothetical protein